MKTAIVYYSQHHGNTKKLLDAIAKDNDVTLINALECASADLSSYDIVGFASGIYYSKFHKTVSKFASENLVAGKKVFFIYTCGVKNKAYCNDMKKIAESKSAEILGSYGCLGFNTFGPFKLFGGMAKKRPNADDISKAVDFYNKITRNL